jgi:hypothetical protein
MSNPPQILKTKGAGIIYNNHPATIHRHRTRILWIAASHGSNNSFTVFTL